MSEFTSLNFSGFPLASALTSQTLFSFVTPQFPYNYFNLIFYSEINPFVKAQKFLVSVFWGDGVYRLFWSLCSTLEVTPDRIMRLTSSAHANCSHLFLQGRLQARSGKSNKSTKWWAVGRMEVSNSLTLCPSHQLSGFASQKYPLINFLCEKKCEIPKIRPATFDTNLAVQCTLGQTSY